ncbi:rho GTPase-activating protein REN1-like [Apium graveolens]|uniref:rho GTPase-activating protein REN1-like n=1 Tax=Apium graveolens TaxID=4045 RepID=UPI003D78D3F3
MTNKNADSSQAAGGGDNAPPPEASATAPAPANAPAADPAPGADPTPVENEPAKPDQENCHAGNKVYKSGPLFLSSRGIGWTSWKKRWFILTSTSLVFFRSDPNVVPPKGSEANLTLGGIDLNSSGSVVVKADKKLLTVLFPDGRDGRAFTLKAETSEDLTAWKEALEEALANAPASIGMGQNGVLKNDQSDAADAPTEQSKEKEAPKTLVTGRPILLALEDVDGTPSFLEKALRFLEEHGVEVEGILRQAADVEDVEHLIREFEQGKKDFSPNDDAHVIADCIKYILRELPSSPVPASCCTALLEASRADRSKRIPAMRAAICETFPEPNRRLLQRILSMMKIVVSHKAVNRMSTSAVAACMAPLLLRPLLAGECELDHDFDMGGDSSIQLMQAAAAANHAQAIVITLLEEYNKFFGDGSNDSGLYSDSEESGSESEELSDDESFEDDEEEEDDGTEGSYSESYEGSEPASGSFTGESDDDISEEKDAKSSRVDDVERSGLKDTERSASLLNGPRRHRRSANWGRTSGRKNRSMEFIDTSSDDIAEVERLEASRAELLHKIKEEEKANAVLYENLKKHKNSLHEQRIILEQDVERLCEQLHQERDLRAALEAGLEVCEHPSSADDKVKEELKDISGAKTDVTNTRQSADDHEQSEQICCLMSDRPQHREQSSNQLKDKHKDAAASTKQSETRNKEESNRADDEKDSKKEPKSQIDSVRGSKHSGYPPNSPSNDSAAGRQAAQYSKRQNSRGEGTTSSNHALSKLTSRLNFLKEKRTQITSDVQNSDKGRSHGQPAHNSESHSSEKSRGSDHIDQNSDKGVSTEGSSTDRVKKSDTHGAPNLERGKSDHIEKGRNAAPARTMSR